MKSLYFILGFLILLAASLIADRLLAKSEAGKIRNYGQKLLIEGKEINVVEKGRQNKQAIVLLPGYGTIAPALDYMPLIDQLAKDFHVYAIEPFGYGDSDLTARPRTIKNMADEIYQITEELHLDHYLLCAHSIAGIYSIYYLKHYPTSVTGFIGLDTSVPKQLKYEANIFLGWTRKFLKFFGLIRWFALLYPQAFMATQPAYSRALKQQIKYRLNRDFANWDNLNEGFHFADNWKQVENLHYPKTIKKLFFLSKQDVKERNWRYIETQNAFQHNKGEIVLMRGTHYIHRDNFVEIAHKIKEEFINR